MTNAKNKYSHSEFLFNCRKINETYPETLNHILNKKDTDEAFKEITSWHEYQPTRLISMQELARDVGVKDIYYKDESTRFGLKSFKALGGAYGVLKYLHERVQDQLGCEIDIKDVRQKKYLDLTKDYFVVTATDGNHGRSVAFGAKLFGCKCQIYIHSEVSDGRKSAMEKLGARVIRINGNYDDSLKVCIEEAQENNWQIISDTSYEGYTEYPRYIMAGYTVLAQEIIDELEGKPAPTHVFLQAGVGGFAAAMCMLFWNVFADRNIQFIIVEPNLAPCLIHSAKAGEISVFNITEETIMTGLSCGEPSLLAWDILKMGADLFMTINDDKIPELMRLMSKGLGKDSGVEAGECSVSGLAALIEAINNKKIAQRLNLNTESRVLLFGTEGATDPSIYEKIINAF
ncbi:MAG: diaminopropionate ammonia-lyase [Pseudomonadota bacterium]|nr:diaminopropionate ammonia-lyase [Pseudomonadota bacterium]